MQFPLSNQAVISLAMIALSACAPATLRAGHSLTPQHDPEGAEPLKEQINAEMAATPEEANPSTVRPPEPSERASVPVLQLASAGKLIGKGGRIALEAAGPSAHWIAYCQFASAIQATATDPRSAEDDTELFLNLPDQDVAIEAVLRSDPSGQFLVVLIDGVAWLIDAVNDARWDLSSLKPDLRFDGLPEHRSFAFTESALLILKENEATEGSLLAGIDLSSLEKGHPISAAQFTVKDQVVYRVEAEGNHVWTVSLPPGSTTRYWPAKFKPAVTRRCNTVQKFDAYSRLSAVRPDPYIRYSWLRLPHIHALQSPPQFTEAPGFVFGFGKGWVRRLDTGRLMLVEGKVQKQVASERCGARVLHADEASGQFLIACEEYKPVASPASQNKAEKSSKKRQPPKYRFDLYLIKPGRVRSLKVDTARTGVDVKGPQDLRLVPLRPGAQSAIVDVQQTKLTVFEGEVQVLATGAAGALLRRGNKLSLWRSAQVDEQALDYTITELMPVLARGSLVAVGNRVFDLSKTFKSWLLPGEPLELTRSGHALIPQLRSESGQFYEGPLALLPPEASSTEQAEN